MSAVRIGIKKAITWIMAGVLAVSLCPVPAFANQFVSANSNAILKTTAIDKTLKVRTLQDIKKIPEKDRSNYTKISIVKKIKLKDDDAANLFSGFDECESITGLKNLDTSNATSMDSMFEGCKALRYLKLPKSFRTSRVLDMGFMFHDCQSLESLTLPETFNTSKVEYMGGMFWNCFSLKSLRLPKSFNTSKVTRMGGMFDRCFSLKSLKLPKSFNTSKVTEMSGMFQDCESLQSLKLPKSFKTSRVEEMGGMFSGCSALKSLDLSNFDTRRAKNSSPAYGGVFSGCVSLRTIKVGKKFTLKARDKGVNNFPEGRWRNSKGKIFNYTKIPNSKADTYTRVLPSNMKATSLKTPANLPAALSAGNSKNFSQNQMTALSSSVSTPAIKAITSNANWNCFLISHDGASDSYSSDYAVQYRANGGDWKDCWHSGLSGDLQVDLDNLEGRDKIYSFRIRKVVEYQYYSDWSAPSEYVWHGMNEKVAIENAQSTCTSMTLTWTKNNYADGYIVEKSKYSNKGFSTAATVTSKNITKVTVGKLTAGSKDYYRVRAYKSVGNIKVLGASPDSFATKPKLLVTPPSAKPTIQKIEWAGESVFNVNEGKVVFDSEVRIKVTEVKGADSYIIQRSTKKNSGYETINPGWRDDGWLLDSSAKPNTTYYYRVVPIVEYDEISSGGSIGLGTPSAAKKISTGGGFEKFVRSKQSGMGGKWTEFIFHWKKASGISGYLIQKSTNKGKTWKTFKKIRGAWRTWYGCDVGGWPGWDFRVLAYK